MLILFQDDTVMNVVLNVFFIETNNLNVFWPQCKDFNLKNQKTNWECEGTTPNYISLLRYFHLYNRLTPFMKLGFRYWVWLRYSALSFWTQPVQLNIVKNCDWPFPVLIVHIKSVQQNLHSWQWTLSRLEPYIFWSFRNLLLFSKLEFLNCLTQLQNNFQLQKFKNIVIKVSPTINKNIVI